MFENSGNMLNRTTQAAMALGASLALTGPTPAFADGTVPGADGPYNGMWPASLLTDYVEEGCQKATVSNAPYYEQRYITSEQITYKLGSKKVASNLGITTLEGWIGNEFVYSCDQMTTNTVAEQVVEKVPSRTRGRAPIIRAIGNIVTVHGDDTTVYDGVLNGPVVSAPAVLKLPKLLTKANVRQHNVGIQYTVTSAPKVQDPVPEAPGPVVSMQRRNDVWIASSQVQG